MNDPEKVIDTAFRDLDHAHFVVTEQQARIAELEAQVGRLRAALNHSARSHHFTASNVHDGPFEGCARHNCINARAALEVKP